MRMNCKDCLHRDGCCNFVPIEGTIEEKAEYLYECLKKPCKDFKNKADFVEVVRCPDCKHCIKDTEYSKKINMGYCEYDNTVHQRTHFCGYGERRKDEDG